MTKTTAPTRAKAVAKRRCERRVRHRPHEKLNVKRPLAK
jgi:hypothetical protein